ncbi:2-oxo-4-hydroxy-4-carboxy-5-ureidoimidazoline decarboxylase [Haloplanus salinarum]|uniref:2-oxo-4-hydroxy-4-carboxy-5-ureidoimidazoline decarboxylase n=1 Tax=Haloplanus salinarum TaxID=1912324 RepID=UPI00214AD49E|nr:2-oxo-4-hydroxy-4-carboxy-5-ureidoimidazoline decarboxylase [Haloplanus salinarum]
MSERTIEELNRADRGTFVDLLGSVYEHSPWVAERSWSDRPFESIDDLHGTMKRVVEDADRERRLELLRAHPDLGERTEMTDASVEEQASAGLDRLTPEQYEAFQRLNERYRDEFGFPFIMAVRDETPDAIRAAMEERVEHSRPEEFRTAIDEVHTIARLRLDERLEP